MALPSLLVASPPAAAPLTQAPSLGIDKHERPGEYEAWLSVLKDETRQYRGLQKRKDAADAAKAAAAPASGPRPDAVEMVLVRLSGAVDSAYCLPPRTYDDLQLRFAVAFPEHDAETSIEWLSGAFIFPTFSDFRGGDTVVFREFAAPSFLPRVAPPADPEALTPWDLEWRK